MVVNDLSGTLPLHRMLKITTSYLLQILQVLVHVAGSVRCIQMQAKLFRHYATIANNVISES